MLESSWGEKFTKFIKNSIINGTNKIDFSLKPKNLGKINVEVSVKDNKALIQINAESTEAANILNENIQKLNEIINYKTEKFADLMKMETMHFLIIRNNQIKITMIILFC